uniref:Sorting nexin-13 n=1 Tax=Meloidogyne incognita TaxID=6306 RepID=A0A914N6X4_MELIC
MPSEDFRCRPLRFLLREIFVTKIFIPLIDCLSEPFFVNRMIVWLLSELPLSTDDFVGCLERCNCVQELESILESVHEEICTLKSKGAGSGENNGNTFTDQLSSLEFTEKLIRRRMIFLVNRTETTEDDGKIQHFKQMASLKRDFANGNFEFAEEAISLASDSDGTIHLPLDVVLANPTCLSHFIEFLNQAGGQNHIDFYLAIQGFKSSMEHQLRSTQQYYLDVDTLETLREAALFMYHQYLSQEALTRVPLSDSIINKFLARLRSNEAQSDFWFEQIEEKLIHILQTETRFFPSFKKHLLYTKMLEEMGIGNNINTLPEEEEEEEIVDEEIIEGKINLNKKYLLLNEEEEGDGEKEEKIKKKKSFNKKILAINKKKNSLSPSTSEEKSVFIEMLGVGHQGRHLFALYNVRFNKANASSNVIRRYSDFHSLHNIILQKFPNLNALSFPGKKTFNNLDRAFLEKRCYALNQYINYILQPTVLSENPGLENLIFEFLSQKNYSANESFINPKAMGKAMFNPIFRGVKAFGNAAAAVPSDLIDGIGKMGSELNRAAFQILGGTSDRQRTIRNQRLYSADSTGSLPESSRVAAHLDEKDSDNIPLRVLLLFVDEVFGLRAKNQWFRRRLVSLLRQFVNATMGNSINRRIVDAVNWLTSEEQVAQYLVAMRDSIWGNNNNNDSLNGGGGFFTDRQSQNSNNNRQNNNTNTNPQDGRQRTRFLARCLMLSAIPDQLRLFIGNTTIQLGACAKSRALYFFSRRIVDAVNWLTSEEQVAQYLVAMRDSIWGNNNNNDSLNGGGGFFTDRQSQNSNNNRQNNNTNTNPQDGRQRTRFLARCLMLSAIPDQLRLFIGNTTIQLVPEFWSLEFWSPRFFGTLVTNFLEFWSPAEFWSLSQKTEYWSPEFLGAGILGVGVNFLIYSKNNAKSNNVNLWASARCLCKIPRFARDFAARASRESTVAGFYNSNINLSLFTDFQLLNADLPTKYQNKNSIENVSEALQNKHLNRRFWYLIFERLLTTIFPNNRFDRLLPQLHSKSPRAQNRAAM